MTKVTSIRRARSFTETVGVLILTRLREGETLKQICKDPNLPDRLTVMNWMKDGRNKVGKKSFFDAYQQAIDDRSLTWQDEAIDLLSNIEIHADRYDSIRLKRAEMKANMLLKVAKEHQMSRKGISVGDNIEVVIKKFAPSPEDD